MTSQGLRIGPLASTTEVVAFVTLTGATWFNSAELLWTILVSFRRWVGKYFWCLIVATLGVFLYQLNVFFMIFKPQFNAHGVIAAIGIGWSCMVTGQSLVLWSRLHLVCRSRWKLRAILGMIVVNGTCLHGTQFVFSLLAVKNNAIDPTYKPFETMEKIAIAIFTAQEFLISAIYLYETTRILRLGTLVQKTSNKRKIQLLFLANVAIIAIDIATVSLEFLALWGIWCSFKGFGYSVKLKIEFAILNQLRDSVKASTSAGAYAGGYAGHSDQGISLAERSKDRKGRVSVRLGTGKEGFEELGDGGERITRTTEIEVRHGGQAEGKDTAYTIKARPIGNGGANRNGLPGNPPSESSSEVEFASKGV